MSRWWQNDMSDASQGLFSDPSLALQIATMPDQILQQTQAQQQAAEQDARKAKSGFLGSMMDFTKSVGGVLDGAMSTLIGDNAANKVEKTLSVGGKAVWWPVDKTASGAYWLYSNGVSQPLSTVLLMAATGQGSGVGGKDKTSYFSAGDWAKSWHEANKLSPAQVVFNAENTYAATDNKSAFSFLGSGGSNLSEPEKQQVKQQAGKFIQDTNYWRDQQGWKYTVGTGALDFMTSMGLDPTYAGLKVVSSGVKGLRSVRITGAALDAATTSRAGTVAGATIDKAANSITKSLAKNPAEASQSDNVNNFFKWTQEPSASGAPRKTGWEIAQHPIWGTGRKINPERYKLSQLLSQADDVEQPMILRFAMGDNTAAQQLAVKNSDLLRQVARVSENRSLVDNAKYDPDLFEHFMQQERLGATAPNTAPGIGGNAASDIGNKVVEPPYPRPTTPGPRQQGWDATYGDIAKQAAVHRAAAGSILTASNGVRATQGASGLRLADQLRFQSWKTGQLADADSQLSALQQKSDIYSTLLGSADKSPEAFTPGQSNLFGTLSNLYRMGPLAGNTEKAADKAINAATRDRALKGLGGDGGFASRTLRKGYYGIPVRVIQSFGDRLPQSLINHNAEDATDRVNDMLKQVPGLGQDQRLGMLNMYDTAGDKVAKDAVLKQIHSQVVEHMASQHNLDSETGRAVAKIVDSGITSAFDELKNGTPRASEPMFTTATNTLTGKRADMYKDGEAWKVAPDAKTKLSYSAPLLDVKELDRFLSRHSGMLSSLRTSGGQVYDGLLDVTDNLSNVWKAATLLRPGYILRAPSEEMAAAAVKFGLIGSIMMTAHGGKNWALNRANQIEAYIGKGDYSSAIDSGKSRIRILDPDLQETGKKLGLPTTRLNVNSAYPVVMAQLGDEKTAAADLEKQIAKMEKDPDHDPNVLAGLHDDLADHNDVIKEFTDYAHAIVRAATDAKGRRIGQGVITHKGIEVPEAFSKEWDNPIAHSEITSDEAMKVAFARGESIRQGRLIKTGHWTSIMPDDPTHMDNWLDALNKQFAQDDLYKKVASDKTLKAAKDWLRTPEGRYHLGVLGPMSRSQDELIQGIADTLQKYTANNPALLDRIANGKEITEADLVAGIRKEDFPDVHGEEVLGLTAHGRQSTASALIDNTINKTFRRLGTIPTDILSRNPTYARAYEARMRQAVDQEVSYQKSIGKDGDSITPEALNKMHAKVDKQAREDIKAVVYDPTRTTATQALRFVAPFLSAHIDGLERWAGLIAEQPQFVGTAARIYNAPVAANLVTDQQGNAVDQNGYVTDRDENGKIIGKHFVGIENRTIHFKVPAGLKNMPGASRLKNVDTPIKIQSLNTILPGDPWWNPGTGPIVSIAASQIAKKDPGFGDFLQWAKVLPYGPQTLGASVTPAYLKNVWDAYHPDSDKFQQAMLQEYQRQVAEHAKGGPLPDMDKAEKQAKQFMSLKALTSWLSPTQTQSTPLTGTPYQFYVDQYKKMQQADPKNADTNFLDKFGEDYFIFTSSLSKSMGIAPTVSALTTAKEYKDLIAGDPSLAPFIIGDVYNQGAFSSSAYFDEQNMKIGGEEVRGKQSVQDAVEDNQRRLGWAEYTKIMNTVDANLIRAGFHSYSQAGAEGFNQTKQNLVAGLKALYPAWEQDYDTTDSGALPRRIQSFEILVQDPRLANDPMRTDIKAMTQYLAYRQYFKSLLAARGVSQLSTDPNGTPYGNNADIGLAWRNVQTGLVAADTKFADAFNRYLSHDNLQ